MKARKLVLLAACGVLLVVCILQAVLKGSDKVRTFDIKDEVDSLVITSPSGNYSIVKEDGNWFVGDKKYPANESSVTSMVEAVTSIKVLDKVASASNDETADRYELSEQKAVTVTAKKGDKVLRTLVIGKEATASSQCYITLDGSKDIYLATGNLSGSLNKTVDELRSKVVYFVEKPSITGVTLKRADGSEDFTITKSGSDVDAVWVVNKPDVLVDGTKAGEWFDSLATVSTPVWHDNSELKGDLFAHVEIRTDAKTVTIDIYKKTTGDDGVTEYFGKCSETPYQFELASYTANKFQKSLSDLIQQ